MDPVTTALVAGAAAALKDMASDAVKAAYHGLKGLLSGKVASLTNLEEDPDDEDYRKATSKELHKKGLTEDPIVLEKAEQLTAALEREPPERLAAAGIDIRQVHAAGEVLIKDLRAKGSVVVVDIEAKAGKVDVSGIEAGGTGKN